MTDQDDPFGDISESLAGKSAEDENDGDRSSATSVERTATSESATASSSHSASTGSSSESTTAESEEASIDQPAFEFDEAEQFAWYALPAVRDEYEEVRDFEVKRLLRDRGFSDVPQSELTNAALAVLAEHPDAWAEKVEEIRRESQ